MVIVSRGFDRGLHTFIWHSSQALLFDLIRIKSLSNDTAFSWVDLESHSLDLNADATDGSPNIEDVLSEY